jgi:hypothetical protein
MPHYDYIHFTEQPWEIAQTRQEHGDDGDGLKNAFGV